MRDFIGHEGDRVEEESKEGRWPDAGDASLIVSFAARRLSQTGSGKDYFPDDIYRQAAVEEPGGGLISATELDDFLAASWQVLREHSNPEVLRRALDFMIPSHNESVASSFLKLFSALESTLTCLRDADAYDILPDGDFSELERDLKRWLKQHAVLANAPDKRALIYEKLRELNRFPFSHIFKRFCQTYEVYLDDLWPVTGTLNGWPLLEIRHRLVHGDPFRHCPVQALLYATEHLRWTAERMLLSVFGWSVERSSVSPDYLTNTSEAYRCWRDERMRFV